MFNTYIVEHLRVSQYLVFHVIWWSCLHLRGVFPAPNVVALLHSHLFVIVGLFGI